MEIDDEKINLSNLIDINFLQKLQDSFTKATNLASIIIDSGGFVTKPSKFSEFCLYTMSLEDGVNRCNLCGLEKRISDYENNQPVISTCSSGMISFIVPINFNAKPIALIVGGQAFTEKPNREFYKKLAKEIGKNENECKNLISKVPIITEEKINSAVELLSLIANSISEIIKKNQREKLIGKIIQELRGTLNKEEIKNYFIKTICNYFDADRCLFIDYNEKTEKFNPIKLEKLKSSEYSSLIDINVETEFPEFLNKIKKNKNIIIRDVKKTFAKNKNYKSMQSLNASGTQSDYGVLIKHQDKFLGFFVLHFLKEKRSLTHDELNFLREISDHAGTAIYQAELYSKTKQQARRENVIRNTIEIIRKSTGLNSVRSEVVQEIGTFLKADRVFFADYDKETFNFSVSDESEYKSSKDVKSFAGNDFAITQGLVEALKNFPLDGKDLIFSDLKNFLEENNIKESDIEKILREMECIAVIVMHINYGEFFYGDIVVTFNNKREIEKEDVDFIKTLADQVGIAIYQAEQYEKIQMQAERERIGRSIVEIMRSSLDKSTIKHLFVKNIGKFFNADRVFFSDFDEENSEFLPVDEKSEYLFSTDEKSIIDFNSKNIVSKKHVMPLIEKKELIIPNWDDYVDNQGLEFAVMGEKLNIKSSYSFPVLYEGQIMGYFCIEFTQKQCKLSTEDINRIRSICTQAGIALHHAGLYLQAKEAIQAKDNIINKVKNKVNDSVNLIINDINELSKFELNDIQNQHFEYIIDNCKELLELTKNIY